MIHEEHAVLFRSVASAFLVALPVCRDYYSLCRTIIRPTRSLLHRSFYSRRYSLAPLVLALISPRSAESYSVLLFIVGLPACRLQYCAYCICLRAARPYPSVCQTSRSATPLILLSSHTGISFSLSLSFSFHSLSICKYISFRRRPWFRLLPPAVHL